MGGSAVTGTTDDAVTGEIHWITTEVSSGLLTLLKPGPHKLTDGLTSNGGDASLFHLGAHELAHGSEQNRVTATEADSERDAGNQVMKQKESAKPEIRDNIRRTRP